MSSIPGYDIGDSIRLGNHAGENEDETVRGAFTDIAGVATDPTTVSLVVRVPGSAAATTYGWPTGVDGNLSKEATGRFYRDLAIATAGLWHWTLSGTGAVATAQSGAFYVRRATV